MISQSHQWVCEETALVFKSRVTEKENHYALSIIKSKFDNQPECRNMAKQIAGEILLDSKRWDFYSIEYRGFDLAHDINPEYH